MNRGQVPHSGEGFESAFKYSSMLHSHGCSETGVCVVIKCLEWVGMAGVCPGSWDLLIRTCTPWLWHVKILVVLYSNYSEAVHPHGVSARFLSLHGFPPGSYFCYNTFLHSSISSLVCLVQRTSPSKAGMLLIILDCPRVWQPFLALLKLPLLFSFISPEISHLNSWNVIGSSVQLYKSNSPLILT